MSSQLDALNEPAEPARSPGGPWRRSWRPPVIATRRAMAWTAAVACAVGGLSGLLGSMIPPAHHADGVVRLASVLSVLAGALFALAGPRLPPVAFYLLAEVATVLIGGSVWLQRDRPEAAGVAALLLIVTVFYFAFFDPVAALPGLATVLVTLVAAQMWWNALPWTTVVVLGGLNVLVAAVVGWLVRAAANAELDSLTGLLNWRGLELRLRSAVARSRRRAQPVTVALLDIDGFTRIVESQGAAEGERILRAFGRAWAGVVRPPAVLGRTRLDEFMVVAPSMTPKSVAPLMESMRAAAPQSCRFSAGVATLGPGDTARMIFRRADTALREAKAAGGNRTAYADDSDEEARVLAAGLAAGEFHVVYQPIVDVHTGRVAGAEALLRWNRASHGPVPPDEFIPMAERSGFIPRLGHWVLETACQDAAAWPRAVPAKVTVNVSGPEMQRSDYAEHVLDILTRTGLPADRLVLEVTESTLQADSPMAIDALHKLRGYGVRIAIDDFGTGYSSLSRLQHLPADILKIDQSFVASLRPTDQSAPLIAAITALAHAMGLRTVAEGVEEHYQAALLAHHGCDEAQGWLHGRPGAAEHIHEALAEQAHQLETLGSRGVPEALRPASPTLADPGTSPDPVS